MSGQIVNSGIKPAHECNEWTAPGRPCTYDMCFGTVWQCECGKFWQLYEQPVVDLEGDYAGTERRWREVLNAEGERWVTEEIPHENYLTKRGWIRDTCMEHGRVWKSHKHWRNVKRVTVYR